MALAKICGVTDPLAVDAALEGGAAFIGFMFYPASPRRLGAEAARRLAEPARGRTRIVAVTVDPDDAALEEIVETLAPDLVQLHGAESPQRVAQIRARHGVGVIKVAPVSDASDLQAAAAYGEVADHLMFDARPPAAAGRPGGAGVAFDWSLMTGFTAAAPWFLAGGLTPDNVGLALKTSGAPVVDVSSGVERSPGLKDPALIRAFLREASRA